MDFLRETDFILLMSASNIHEYRSIHNTISKIPGVTRVRTYFVTQSFGRNRILLDFYDYFSEKKEGINN